jgi:hypothetical protein
MEPLTTIQAFDLVAPIVICGGADCEFEKKAIAAWKKIIAIDPQRTFPELWTNLGCPSPIPFIDNAYDLSISDDFDAVYNDFALDAYNALFASIVEEHGHPDLRPGYDYWGAKGYRFPDEHSKNFSLVGSDSGKLPFYETAALLIQRLHALTEAQNSRPDPAATY